MKVVLATATERRTPTRAISAQQARRQGS